MTLLQWDFSELSDDELSVEPTAWRTYDKTDPEQVESFLNRLKTKLTVQISDVPEILDPETLQLTPVSVSDYCDGIKASLSDKTLETSYDNEVYWLSNQIGKDEMIKLGNETACRVDSIALHDGIQDSFDIDIYAVKDSESYIITFSTDPKDVPIMVPMAEKMIGSFRFL